jgi:hypothetical protein
LSNGEGVRERQVASAAVVLIVLLFSIIATVVPVSSASGSSGVIWSQLRGANYNWTPLWFDTGGSTPAPSISLPLMRVNGGMNFVRQPIYWDAYVANPSAYLSALRTLASEADQEGFSIVYDFHSNMFARFPPNVELGYAGDPTFMDAYMSNSITVGSQSVWAYQMSDFWQPVIAQVDSHPSTIGYELLNEPPVGGSTLQAYHAYFAEKIRALTTKAIVFGSDKFDEDPSSSTAPPASTCTFGGSTCAIDVHLYTTTDPSNEFASWASIARSMGYPVILGEFAPCIGNCSFSDEYVQTFLNTYVQDARNNGFGMSYWYWNCNEYGPATDYSSLLSGTCQPDKLLGFLSTSYDNILGISTSTTTPTALMVSTTQGGNLGFVTADWVLVAIGLLVVVAVLLFRVLILKPRRDGQRRAKVVRRQTGPA